MVDPAKTTIMLFIRPGGEDMIGYMGSTGETF